MAAAEVSDQLLYNIKPSYHQLSLMANNTHCLQHLQAESNKAGFCCRQRCTRALSLEEQEWNCLTIDLRYMASSLDSDADVHILEPLLSQKRNRLLDLEAQGLWLNEIKRRP